MSLFAAILPLIAQIGPNPSAKLPPIPPEIRDRPARPVAAPAPAPVTTAPPIDPQSPRLSQCLELAGSDAEAALADAQAWSAAGTAAEKADAKFCEAMALIADEEPAQAQAALAAALVQTPAASHARRARIGALAGNLALGEGDAAAAAGLLEGAAREAAAVGDRRFSGEIEIDRARALVATERNGEAAMALARAAAAMPDNAQVWLLSATLARRVDQIDRAQLFIQKAAELNPVDPAIGLEAGVIAMLAGREDAARRSWQSVIDAAPTGPAAQTARGYLAQLPVRTQIEGR